jgi:hypothetical protein
MTVEQHANQIKAIEAGQNNFGQKFPTPFLRIADPAIKQRSAITGLSIQIEYSQHGIDLALGSKRDVNAGLDKMNNYLRTDKWLITESCPNLQKEMRTYKRSQYATSKLREKNNKKEEPQKKNDHAIDGCRYFYSYMPELVIEEISKKPRLTREQVASLMAPGSTIDLHFPEKVDKNLFADQPVTIIHDNYVGEY